MRIFVVSGLSGAGKSVALRALEDAGVYCVDNAPASLLPMVSDEIRQSGKSVFAFSFDVRNTCGADRVVSELDLLSSAGFSVEGVFLTASREEIQRRFNETRRRHPLAETETDLMACLDREAEMMRPLSERFGRIDTTGMKPSALCLATLSAFSTQPLGMRIRIESFGFKKSPPPLADFVFDARCLPNPHWRHDLRDFDGTSQPIMEFFHGEPAATGFADDVFSLLERRLLSFETEGRPQLNVAIGCTGGKHRSVWLAEEMGRRFMAIGRGVSVFHRSLDTHAAR